VTSLGREVSVRNHQVLISSIVRFVDGVFSGFPTILSAQRSSVSRPLTQLPPFPLLPPWCLLINMRFTTVAISMSVNPVTNESSHDNRTTVANRNPVSLMTKFFLSMKFLLCTAFVCGSTDVAINVDRSCLLCDDRL
jgi:hypothetical protein